MLARGIAACALAISPKAIGLAGVTGGMLVPLRVTRVLASGTTAGAIVGLW